MENNTIDLNFNEETVEYTKDLEEQDRELIFNFVKQMLLPKAHIAVAPTFTPKNFWEQVQLFDDGVDIRLYLFVNNTWRYVALT